MCTFFFGTDTCMMDVRLHHFALVPNYVVSGPVYHLFSSKIVESIIGCMHGWENGGTFKKYISAVMIVSSCAESQKDVLLRITALPALNKRFV